MLLLVSCLLFFSGSIFAEDVPKYVCAVDRENAADPDFDINYFAETKSYLKLGVADSTDSAEIQKNTRQPTCSTMNVTKEGDSTLKIEESDDDPVQIKLTDVKVAKGTDDDLGFLHVYPLASGKYFVEAACNYGKPKDGGDFDRVAVSVLVGSNYEEAVEEVQKILKEKGIGFYNFDKYCDEY